MRPFVEPPPPECHVLFEWPLIPSRTSRELMHNAGRERGVHCLAIRVLLFHTYCIRLTAFSRWGINGLLESTLKLLSFKKGLLSTAYFISNGLNWWTDWSCVSKPLDINLQFCHFTNQILWVNESQNFFKFCLAGHKNVYI